MFRIIAFVLLLCGWIGGAAANALLSNRMLEDVNSRLPAPEQFSWVGWSPAKYATFLRAYMHLGLPKSRLLLLGLLFVAMAGCVVLALWMLQKMAL